MQISKMELALIRYALLTEPSDGEHPKQRAFGLEDQGTAIAVMDKVMALAKGDDDKKEFADGEIKFELKEKNLVLKVTARPWGVEDARFYLSLKAKLEA